MEAFKEKQEGKVMNELRCPNCNIPYSDPDLKRCLLCGGELEATLIGELVATQTASKKVKEIEQQLEATQVDDNEVPVFDDKGGFSKRTTKEGLVIGQLQADKEALESRLSTFEDIYKKEHPKGKPWYTSPLNWFMFLLVLGLLYFIYWWVESQGGLPKEFYDFIRRIRTWINW